VDRSAPNRDEYGSNPCNAVAGMGALVAKRLVEALTAQRQQEADLAKKELEVCAC
jgi:hypothetical protein